jgi:hypothetical protein
MMGDSDTLNYVNLVNDKLLPKLKAQYNAYIKWTGDDYYIDTIELLNDFCEDLNTSGSGSEYNSGLLYPYFYSSYLYQPNTNNGEELNEQYTKHNWYSPSVGELSRIIYYRGYSVNGSSFMQRDCREDINSSVISGGTPQTTPIFSLALKAMGGANFPNVWRNIVGAGTVGTKNNITTSVSGNASDSDNYSY